MHEKAWKPADIPPAEVPTSSQALNLHNLHTLQKAFQYANKTRETLPLPVVQDKKLGDILALSHILKQTPNKATYTTSTKPPIPFSHNKQSDLYTSKFTAKDIPDPNKIVSPAPTFTYDGKGPNGKRFNRL